jgi:outer membrane protein assembly factor BamE (lipoprotein component of BamABCDE complex)
MMAMMTRTILVIGTAAMLAGGCTRIRDRQGFLADAELIQAIQPGVDNRDSVAKTLGRPTFASKWDADTWYYVARGTKQLAFLPQKTEDQTLLTVRFDAAGNVASINRNDKLDQIVQLDPEDDKTPVFGRDRSLFDEIFGNIGAVGAAGTGPGGGADNPN